MHARLRFAVAAALLASSAVAASAQDATGKIEGTVVDSATGQPVPAAHISMVLEDRVPDGFTDASGGFRFEGLAPDRYRLTVKHAGYRDSKRNVELTDEAPSATVTIKLTQLSEIGGQVLDDDGHPMSGVLIYSGSSSSLQATTDANGRYRIADLTPGDYLFYCRLTFAVREKLLQRNEETGETMGYADTYYFPDVEDRSRAIRTMVAPGMHVSGVDFRLRRTHLVEFNGRVLDPVSGEPLTSAAVELEAGGLTDQTRQRRMVGPGASFRFELIPPGQYTLAVWRGEAKPREQQPPAAEPVLRGMPSTERPVLIPVEVGRGGLTGAELRVPACVDLTVNITAPHPDRTRGAFAITLTRPNSVGKGEMFAVPAVCQVGRSCVIPGVPPGEWIFDVQGSLVQSGEPSRVLAVDGIRFGQQNAWNVPVIVAEGGNPPVEISVTDQTGTISIAVSMDQGRPADSFPVVVRRVGATAPERRRFSSFQSAALAPGLLPGDYELALVVPADDEDVVTPVPIERCGDRIGKVTVTAGQTSTVTLQPCVPEGH